MTRRDPEQKTEGTKPAPNSPSRRDFLATGGLLAAAAAAPRAASALAGRGPLQSGERTTSPGSMRRIPIGVFDPAFPDQTRGVRCASQPVSSRSQSAMRCRIAGIMSCATWAI